MSISMCGKLGLSALWPWPRLWLLLLLLSPSLHASGIDESSEAADKDLVVLDPLVVVASKTPRALSTVPAQVSVIDAAEIRAQMVEDLDGLLRYEPGLELENSGTRFGATSINIRGIGGNRVAIEVDGIPVRDRFVVGSFSDAGRASIETDRIKRVEVLHGPASVMYGSNALGGIVSITSWDPDDLLSDSSGAGSAWLRAGYQGVNEGRVGSGIAAVGQGAHGLLMAATWREGHEADNQAPADLPHDPQGWDSQDLMLRYTFDTVAGNRLRLTASGQQRSVETEIRSQLGYGRRFATTTELRGIDEHEHRVLSAEYDFTWGGWETGLLRLYHTQDETDQLTLETRGRANPPVALERKFVYEQQHTGFDFNLFHSFAAGASLHRLGLGFEWLETDTSELRDGQQTNLLTGASTPVILGESMPVRDFPDSRSRGLGLFVQDEISWPGARWELIPALRWDRYELDPSPDAIWLADFPDMEIVPVEDSQITPRLAVLYKADSGWRLYGQYSRGFRAPPFEDANIGLVIPLFGYRAIPNPDLRSETSDGFELGVRRLVDGTSFSLAAFHTRYDEFIESRALIGTDPQTGELLFQSRNIDRAWIRGLDIRFEQELGAWSDALAGFSLEAAGYWSEGENRENGQPLNSIAPPQAVLGAAWTSPAAVFHLELTSTITAAKTASDIDQTAGARYATAGWGVVDLTASWRVSSHLEVNAGIFNLGDRTYWRWLDVARLEPADPMITILSRPGRSYSLSTRFSF